MSDAKETEVSRAVYAAVAKETGMPRSELRPETLLEESSGVGADGYYRIIVDIERRLGVSTFDGNWCFDDASIESLVRYCVRLHKDREMT